MEQKRPQGWEQALLQRNKLVEYDKNSEQRTQVYYYDSKYTFINCNFITDSIIHALTGY